MSQFTHKFREKFEDLRKRHWGKDHHKFGKCAPLEMLIFLSFQRNQSKGIIPIPFKGIGIIPLL